MRGGRTADAPILLHEQMSVLLDPVQRPKGEAREPLHVPLRVRRGEHFARGLADCASSTFIRKPSEQESGGDAQLWMIPTVASRSSESVIESRSLHPESAPVPQATKEMECEEEGKGKGESTYGALIAQRVERIQGFLIPLLAPPNEINPRGEVRADVIALQGLQPSLRQQKYTAIKIGKGGERNSLSG